MDDNRLFTIGHSNRTYEEFLPLLKERGVTALADVRSSPYSGRNPQFNREAVKDALKKDGIDYVFLGEELGARRSESECYHDETAKYELIADLPLFQLGLSRIRKGLRTHRIALMCAERDPLVCHRAILVCRHLKSDDRITHILDHGEAEQHADSEMRLLKLVGLSPNDLFQSVDELIDHAYALQGERIAYRAEPARSDSQQKAESQWPR